MASDLTNTQTNPPKDGDPLWQQDFPINRGDELNNSRRQFLKFLGLTSLAFFTGTLGVALKALFEENRTPTLQPAKIEGADKLQVGESLPFYYPDESYPALLIRISDRQYVAYEQRCSHLLCPVLYQHDKARIYCPCHEGVFEPETGRNIAGPPPRPLNPIKVEARSDGIYATGRG